VSAAGHAIHFHRMKGMLLLTLPPESINDVFSRLKKGQVNGRIVLGLKEENFVTAAMARVAS
jgi:D-arabinose 1-dehydrogenase-like Zn-dependent alcohol dehydrogenase